MEANELGRKWVWRLLYRVFAWSSIVVLFAFPRLLLPVLALDHPDRRGADFWLCLWLDDVDMTAMMWIFVCLFVCRFVLCACGAFKGPGRVGLSIVCLCPFLLIMNHEARCISKQAGNQPVGSVDQNHLQNV